MTRNPLRPYPPRRGFALLVTIVLVAFLVLILVGLATFTRVETQVAGNSEKLALARQNALTGLNVAVGQLQRYAGPDNRLTARSDITVPGAINHPYFTGVWRPINNTTTPDAWLVNGNETNPVAVTPAALDPTAGTFPVTDAGATGEVFLVGRASVQTDAERIRVAKTNLTAAAGSIPGVPTQETIGHYAYWVGDEGIKASASLIDPLQDPAKRISYNNAGGNPGDDWSGASNAQRDRLNQLMLPRPRLERLLTSLAPDLADNPPLLTELPKVVQAPQLQFLTAAPAITVAQRRGVFHSVTPLSEAVLVDHSVIPGRLKRDLSDPAGASAAGDAILAYRNFRAVNPAVGFIADYTPRTIAPAGSEPANSGVASFSAGPVIKEIGFKFFFTADAAGAVSLTYLVEVALWNPYSARLVLTPPAAAPLTKLRLDIENLQDITVSDQTTAGTATIPMNALVSAFVLAVDNTQTWAPGEIKLLSGTSGVDLTPGGAQVTVATGRTMAPGDKVDRVNYPAVANLRVTLRWDDNTGVKSYIQIYEPNTAFAVGSTTPTVPPIFTSFSCGYGFALADNLEKWTNGDSAAPLDPRSTTLTGAFTEAPKWDVDIGANNSTAVSADLALRPKVVLFDVPRQELVSISDLRNLTRINATAVTPESPAMLGNGWGGTVNQYFDKYFFSTVPRNHVWNFAAQEPLPNRYLRYYQPADAVAPNIAAFLDPDNAARYLMNRGAFNINSTSVDAWQTILGARVQNWLQQGAAGAIILDNVFFRLSHGAQHMDIAPVSGAAVTDAESVTTGGRQLTAAQVTSLATEIVRILRARGRPFDSLEEFLNYNNGVGGDPKGVIAQAIAATALNNPTVNADFRFAPGALTQADVVAGIAPFITPRSDTFLVRTYGDSQNPVTGAVEARVWGEAVVQRVPETVDPIAGGESPITPTGTFGRKFKITSFRWLTPDDL